MFVSSDDSGIQVHRERRQPATEEVKTALRPGESARFRGVLVGISPVPLVQGAASANCHNLLARTRAHQCAGQQHDGGIRIALLACSGNIARLSAFRPGRVSTVSSSEGDDFISADQTQGKLRATQPLRGPFTTEYESSRYMPCRPMSGDAQRSDRNDRRQKRTGRPVGSAPCCCWFIRWLF